MSWDTRRHSHIWDNRISRQSRSFSTQRQWSKIALHSAMNRVTPHFCIDTIILRRQATMLWCSATRDKHYTSWPTLLALTRVKNQLKVFWISHLSVESPFFWCRISCSQALPLSPQYQNVAGSSRRCFVPTISYSPGGYGCKKRETSHMVRDDTNLWPQPHFTSIIC